MHGAITEDGNKRRLQDVGGRAKQDARATIKLPRKKAVKFVQTHQPILKPPITK